MQHTESMVVSTSLAQRLSQSFRTSFLDAQAPSEEPLRACLLCNVRGEHKLLDDIEEELRSCDAFDISVAFITQSGLTPLLQTFLELEERGIPGRVLTTDYLGFSEPRAIRRLMSLGNVSVRIYRTKTGSSDGFHTKAYLFSKGSTCRAIIGSANLTDTALSVSREWNTRLVSHRQGEFSQRVQAEFEALWNHAQSCPAEAIIDRYEQEYETHRRIRSEAQHILDADSLLVYSHGVPQPNAMQQAFLENLDRSNSQGLKRALLISATGTGKTYAAAFAVRRMQPGRLLFLVHREQIARQALTSFHRVLGGKSSDFGLLTGDEKEEEGRKYVFATIQTVVRRETLESLQPDAFDMILIDEVHRAGAPSYQKVMAHFRPAFWLGMTGSPDRTDGFDIYALFGHNIVYEIRLQQALDYDLLCPFHYFGIGELSVSLDRGPCTVLEKKQFLSLEEDEMIRQVLEKADYYGWSGDRVRGLVFTASREQAEIVAAGFRRHGRKALALTGSSTQDEREEAVRRLTTGTGENRYDYLVTVDIFNEGVDLPEVNQIILLRPTQSPIVFVQQLGRGLRKHPGKEFVVVLDFIANHDNNFLIPLALTGDRTYSKDRLRRAVAVQRKRIPGISSVHFDRVARERIYQSIDRARTNSMSLLTDCYLMLKNKLGRIPGLLDFEEHGQIDGCKYLQATTGFSYHAFLCRKEPDYTIRLSPLAEQRLAWMGRKLGNGLRPSEAMVLEAILAGKDDIRDELVRRLQEECGFACTERHLRSVEKMLTNQFEQNEQARLRNSAMTFLCTGADGAWTPDPDFCRTLEQEPDFARLVQELLTFILRRWRSLYAERYRDTMFRLGAVYTYEDVCRLLEWETLMPSQNIGGYFYDRITRTMPVFINYSKPDDAIPYEDHFENSAELVSLSKTNRRSDSADARRMTRQPPYEETRILLFVRRNKEDREAKGFYFLGDMRADKAPQDITMPGGKPAFEVHWTLDTAVEPGLFEYLTGEETT